MHINDEGNLAGLAGRRMVNGRYACAVAATAAGRLADICAEVCRSSKTAPG